MDQVGQIGQNPMQSHPLSQSMDSVNTASNEEEVSHHSSSIKGSCHVLCRRKSVFSRRDAGALAKSIKQGKINFLNNESKINNYNNKTLEQREKQK